jgi:CheY-like chemotaxis protein
MLRTPAKFVRERGGTNRARFDREGTHVTSEKRKSRVLVVDDQADCAEVVSVLLTIMGYECKSALSGTEALAQAETFEPDVVLLDLQLPDVSGYEVARELRRRAGKRPLHIAAVSGMSTPDVRARAHAAGFDQHLAKPTDAAKLRHVLYIADLRARST